MVVVAHADDAEFGCSGTVAKWCAEGVEVVYVICTDGSKGTGDRTITSEELSEIRTREQVEAGKVLGLKDVVFLGYPDAYLEPTLELRRDIAREIRRHRPDVVICMYPMRKSRRRRLGRRPPGPHRVRRGDAGRHLPHGAGPPDLSRAARGRPGASQGVGGVGDGPPGAGPLGGRDGPHGHFDQGPRGAHVPDRRQQRRGDRRADEDVAQGAREGPRDGARGVVPPHLIPAEAQADAAVRDRHSCHAGLSPQPVLVPILAATCMAWELR